MAPWQWIVIPRCQSLAPSPTTLDACADRDKRNGYGSNVGAQHRRTVEFTCQPSGNPLHAIRTSGEAWSLSTATRGQKEKGPHCPPDLPQYTHVYRYSVSLRKRRIWMRTRQKSQEAKRLRIGHNNLSFADKSYLSLNKRIWFHWQQTCCPNRLS